ncbi:hypothetical protein HYU11_04420 [Candidatus Woesearchaeota archaeon]|nr:hypothetical protein [Candidatus Woesearchaeota archaeon]
MADQIPKCYSTFEQESARLDRVVATLELDHMSTFVSAARETLMNGARHVDYSRLEEAEARNAFFTSMMNSYGEGSRRWLGLGAGHQWDDMQALMAMSGVYGLTGDMLSGLMRQQGQNFNIQYFGRLLTDPERGLLTRTKTMLEPLATRHLTDDDKPAMISAIGLDGKLNPGNATLDNIIDLARIYRTQGVIAPRQYSHLVN